MSKRTGPQPSESKKGPKGLERHKHRSSSRGRSFDADADVDTRLTCALRLRIPYKPHSYRNDQRPQELTPARCQMYTQPSPCTASNNSRKWIERHPIHCEIATASGTKGARCTTSRLHALNASRPHLSIQWVFPPVPTQPNKQHRYPIHSIPFISPYPLSMIRKDVNDRL